MTDQELEALFMECAERRAAMDYLARRTAAEIDADARARLRESYQARRCAERATVRALGIFLVLLLTGGLILSMFVR